MVAKRQHDYRDILEKCKDAMNAGIKPEWEALGEAVNIPRATLQHIFHHFKIRHPRDIAGHDNKNVVQVYEKLEDGDKLTHTIDGNFEEFVSVNISGQIRTVDDLIKFCKIDTEKYILLAPEIRKWDVTVKLRSHDGPDKVIVVPQIYISQKTMARNPEPVMPVIRPIEIVMSEPARVATPKGKLHRELILPDVHMGFRRRMHTQDLTPFHDRRVLDIVVQILSDGWFDGISVIGDALDLAEFSTKFTPEPEFYFTTQPALIEWSWWLGQFKQAAPDAEIKQYEGNHDKRLGNMISSYMPAAYQLRAVDQLEMSPALSMERLLAMDALGVEYVTGYPDNYRWLNQKVLIRHGDVVRSGPGDSAKAVVTRTTYTTIFGHVHRKEMVSRRIKSRDGDIFQEAICPGCACHIDGRVPGSKSDDQWQQGIAVVEYTDTKANITTVAIEEGETIYNGQMYRARNRDGEAEKMLLKKLEKIGGSA